MTDQNPPLSPEEWAQEAQRRGYDLRPEDFNDPEAIERARRRKQIQGPANPNPVDVG